VLTAVRRKSVREWAVAREATVRDVQGSRLILLFQHQVHASMLSKSPKTLADAISEMIGGRWEIQCEIAGQTPPPAQDQLAQVEAPVQAPVQAQVQAPQADRAPAPRPPTGAATDNGRARAAASGRDAAATTDDSWPTAAVPGGDGWPAAAVPGGQTATATAPAPARAPATRPAPARPEPQAQPAARPTSQPAPVPAAARAGWSEEPPPVYESDYGFDPGDEPVDEDGPVVRETSEEQALRLLREHLGAERID
jgi:DNA polymerase-3 subunit gamma/tau